MAKFKVNIMVAPDISQMGVFLIDASGKSTPLPKATNPSGEDKIIEEGDYAVWNFAQPVSPETSTTARISREGSVPLVGNATESDARLVGRLEFRLRNGVLT